MMEDKKLAKHRSIAFICLSIIMVVIIVFMYQTISRGEGKNEKEKALSEVEFIEVKLVVLLNKMNNIEIRNYNVSVTEISKKQSTEDETNTYSDNSSKNSKNKENTTNEKSDTSSEQKATDKESKNQQTEKFQLKETGILTRSEDIHWEQVKNDVEILYSSIPTITLDLYQMQVAQEDILNFNKELDLLTLAVQKNSKEETLKSLSALYDYIPKFIEKTTDDNLIKTVIQAKSNLFKAYSRLDSKNWQEISDITNKSIETVTKLLTDTNIDSNKQYTVNKIYIMLNELQNAVKVQDINVFLIKYKNILEEMNDL